MKKILFLDRDGTLVEEPSDEQIDQISKVKLLPDVIPSLLGLKKKGFRFVMITNQDGLGSDSYKIEDFETSQQFILEIFRSQGIIFDDIFICPHLPDDRCDCRKPKVSLLIKYLKDPSWDRANSYVIGDRETDIKLAEAIGIESYKVGVVSNKDKGVYGWSEISELISKKPRIAIVKRETKETSIQLALNLDNDKTISIDTGISFFDHMLDQLFKHSGIGVSLNVKGDLEVDEHHTVEDTALAIGEGVLKAIGDKINIGRYGFLLPMDEAKAEIALDLSGRSYFVFHGDFNREYVGNLPTELVCHFFEALAASMKATINISVSGKNCHHKVEAIFKGVGRALRQALSRDYSGSGVPSTKGVL